MFLSAKEKKEKINKIQLNFLTRVREIEAERDRRLAALVKEDDQQKITQILSDLSKK